MRPPAILPSKVQWRSLRLERSLFEAIHAIAASRNCTVPALIRETFGPFIKKNQDRLPINYTMLHLEEAGVRAPGLGYCTWNPLDAFLWYQGELLAAVRGTIFHNNTALVIKMIGGKKVVRWCFNLTKRVLISLFGKYPEHDPLNKQMMTALRNIRHHQYRETRRTLEMWIRANVKAPLPAQILRILQATITLMDAVSPRVTGKQVFWRLREAIRYLEMVAPNLRELSIEAFANVTSTRILVREAQSPASVMQA